MSEACDHAREACGVVGVYSPSDDVASIAFFGLHARQHRGQESAGIATGDGRRIHVRKAMGLITQGFSEVQLSQLPGHIAVAHTRYSTTGSSNIANAQPIISQGTNVDLARAT